MDRQPGMHGLTEVDQVPDAAPAPQPPTPQPVAQDTTAPALRTLGELITGPEATHWSHLLVRDHLDKGAKLALLRTSTATNTLVLGAAEQAAIDLRCALPAARLQAAKRALVTRGKLRTKLVIYAPDASQMSSALGVLEPGMQWVDHLDASVECTPSMGTVIARCCPNLRLLETCAPAELPSPELFPKLEELSMSLGMVYFEGVANHDKLEHLYRTVGRFIPQLTSLCLRGSSYPPTSSLALLLGPDNIGTRLRTFRLDTTLDDTLLGLLLQCAPALEDLTVHQVEIKTNVHAHVPTHWRRLVCARLNLASLSRLPLPAGVEIVMGTLSDEIVFEFDAVSIEEAGGDRLKNLSVTLWPDDDGHERLGGHVYITGGYEQFDDDEAAAMCVGFALLRRWFEQEALDDRFYVRLTLEGWTMSAEVVGEMAGMPTCDAVEFDDEDLRQPASVVWLPDLPHESYAPLLANLPGTVEEVCIRADELGGEQLVSICLGAPQNRTTEKPLLVRFPGCRVELVEIIQGQLGELLPNVSFSD